MTVLLVEEGDPGGVLVPVAVVGHGGWDRGWFKLRVRYSHGLGLVAFGLVLLPTSSSSLPSSSSPSRTQ